MSLSDPSKSRRLPFPHRCLPPLHRSVYPSPSQTNGDGHQSKAIDAGHGQCWCIKAGFVPPQDVFPNPPDIAFDARVNPRILSSDPVAMPSTASETLDEATRNLLRRLGGLPHIRRLYRVAEDPPIPRAYWRHRLAADVQFPAVATGACGRLRCSRVQQKRCARRAPAADRPTMPASPPRAHGLGHAVPRPKPTSRRLDAVRGAHAIQKQPSGQTSASALTGRSFRQLPD